MKILIHGGYGCNNLGDDAQLLNNCNFLRKHNFTNVKIISPRPYLEQYCLYPTVVSFRHDFLKSSNAILIKRFYEILDEKKLSEKGLNLINEIKSCDVLFMSGSGTLNTRHYFGMLRALLPIALAIKFNKRVILSGQGFSPMDNAELEKILAHYLNQCEFINIRDFEQGSKILTRIGVDSNLIHQGCDDAITLKSGYCKKLPEKSVAFNLSCYGSKPIYELLIQFADYLKSKNYNPIFNSFHPKDKIEIEKYVNNKYEVVEFDNPTDAKALFKQCHATIGMRYHSAILSFGVQTPVINIALNEYQLEKFNSINKEGIIIPCLNGQTLTLDILKNIFDNLSKTTITEVYKKWEPKAQMACKYLANHYSQNSLLNLIKKRRSVRKFKDISIPKQDLLDLVEAGIYAPSGSNTQCYRFKIITDKEDICFLAKNKIKCVNNASAIIMVASDLDACGYLKSSKAEVFDKLPYQDCAMAMQNICLLAEDKEIAQCVVHLSKTWWSNDEIKKHFSIPESYELQGMIILGYSDEEIDYETVKHAGRLIKRKSINEYLF